MFSADKNPYLKHLQENIRMSPKIPFIKRIIDERGFDWRGRKAQVLIFYISSAVVHTLVLYLKILKELKVVFLDSSMKTSEKQFAINSFQEHDIKMDVLITTCNIRGTGITLNNAMRTIYAQAPSNSALIRQIRARMHRIGNPNVKSIYIYELYTEGCGSEDVSR